MKKILNKYLLDLVSFEALQNAYIEKYSDQLKKAPEALNRFIENVYRWKNQLEEYELENGYNARMELQKKLINKLF